MKLSESDACTGMPKVCLRQISWAKNVVAMQWRSEEVRRGESKSPRYRGMQSEPYSFFPNGKVRGCSMMDPNDKVVVYIASMVCLWVAVVVCP